MTGISTTTLDKKDDKSAFSGFGGGATNLTANPMFGGPKKDDPSSDFGNLANPSKTTATGNDKSATPTPGGMFTSVP